MFDVIAIEKETNKKIPIKIACEKYKITEKMNVMYDKSTLEEILYNDIKKQVEKFNFINCVEDAREITETLLANRTVVLNLEGIEVDVAQRIIDFTSGSCYAIQGNLQKISHYIFIITPASVDISGDFQEILSGSSSFDVPYNHS